MWRKKTEKHEKMLKKMISTSEGHSICLLKYTTHLHPFDGSLPQFFEVWRQAKVQLLVQEIRPAVKKQRNINFLILNSPLKKF